MLKPITHVMYKLSKRHRQSVALKHRAKFVIAYDRLQASSQLLARRAVINSPF